MTHEACLGRENDKLFLCKVTMIMHCVIKKRCRLCKKNTWKAGGGWKALVKKF